MLQITRTEAMNERVKRNYYKQMTISASAADIGVSYQTLRMMEADLGLRRPQHGFRRHRPSTSKNATWEGAHYMVICLCRTYCIVTKHSNNPRYPVAKRIPLQEIVYEAKGEKMPELVAIAKRWERELNKKK